MKELIAVISSQVSGQSIPTVNARDLHEFLESKKDFSTWIKDRIEKYGFIENQDYVTCSTKRVSSSGTKHAIDYHLTLDMAKELSMVERDEKVACVGQALHELARERISEALSLVKTHVGRVKIPVAMVGNSKGIPVGTMLSCRLESGEGDQ